MKKNNKCGAFALLFCGSTLAMVGCGGGGSASSSPPPPPPPSSLTYTVGGSVSGLSDNENVTLLNNGVGAVTITGNGAFTFSSTQPSNSNYAATVQSHTPGIACSVEAGSGSVGSSNVNTVSVSCGVGTESILYSFTSPGDGTNPQAGLITDAIGNLYGTTYAGGMANSIGTVFKISQSGTESVLYSFMGPLVGDGANPQGNLIMDAAGNLYGTTSGGGANGFGTVFKITPEGKETVIYSFAGGGLAGDGAYPQKGLVMDTAGNLYGTTSQGGTGVGGTVFKINGDGSETVLHSFTGSPTDGRVPMADLMMDSGGNLYGTTDAGGIGAYDFGTVFKISANGTESVVHTFTGTDGGNPRGTLIMDSAGNLYGTTYSAGTATVLTSGEVFKIDTSGTLSVLHYFTGGITPTIIGGGYPLAGLIIDKDGNLFGTTSSGGPNGGGMVYKITPAGTLTMLHGFSTAPLDGNEPVAGLTVDSFGNLYGTTAVGGENDLGIVFKID